MHLAGRIDRSADRTCGQVPQDLIDQPEALLDLADAHPDAGVNVTGLEHGNLEREPIIGRIAGRLARIESTAAGTPDITAGAELPCQVAAKNSSGGRAVLRGGVVVVELEERREKA